MGDGPNIYLPLFERLENDDRQELAHYRNLATKLQTRVKELEQINTNLESRLEREAKANIGLERSCVHIQNTWRSKCEALSKEIEDQKREIMNEKAKSDKLRETLSRTERELYGILQRKYEYMKGPAGRPGPGPAADKGAAAGAGAEGAKKEGAGEDFFQVSIQFI